MSQDAEAASALVAMQSDTAADAAVEADGAVLAALGDLGPRQSIDVARGLQSVLDANYPTNAAAAASLLQMAIITHNATSAAFQNIAAMVTASEQPAAALLTAVLRLLMRARGPSKSKSSKAPRRDDDDDDEENSKKKKKKQETERATMQHNYGIFLKASHAATTKAAGKSAPVGKAMAEAVKYMLSPEGVRAAELVEDTADSRS